MDERRQPRTESPAPHGPPSRAMLGPHDRIIRPMVAAVGLLLGVMLVVMGGSCARQALAHDRNVQGNPASEELVRRCTVPGTGATIRLYRGGGGATVASWYSVTHQRAGGRELQFWFSYSKPVVSGIACRAGTVELWGESGTPAVATFRVDRIERDLVPRPLVYMRGEPRRVSRDSVEAAGIPEHARLTLFAAIPALGAGVMVAILSARALARALRT